MRTVGKILAMAALCATALTGSANVTMTMTPVEGRKVKLAFTMDSLDRWSTYELCVAYGPEKGGDDKYKWANFIPKVAEIDYDTESLTYNLPNEITQGMYYRFFLLDRSKYDLELEYIATTSASCQQYIDSGVIGRLGTKIEANFYWMNGGDAVFVGANNENNRFYGPYFYRHTVNGELILSWGYGFGGGCYWISTSSFPNTPSYFHVISYATTNSRWLEVNDEKQYNYTSTKNENDFNTGLNMYIFCCNSNGGPANGIEARLYDMKIWQGNPNGSNFSLVRNFRPVFANGDGALYDEVYGNVFENKGNTLFDYAVLPDAENRSGVVKAMSMDILVMDEEERRRPVVSYWIGAADGDLAKAANWCSTNANHEGITAAPVSTTEVHFRGNVRACWASASDTLGAKDLNFDDAAHLAGDCDLRALGAAPFKGHLNLNGWKLQLAGLTGTGAITDRPFAVDGYQALDYIDSNAGCYIDTGVTGASGVTVEIDVMDIENYQGEQCVVGSYDKVNVKRFMPFYRWYNLLCFGYNDTFKGSGDQWGRHANDDFDQDKRYLGYNRMYNGSQNTYMNGLLAWHDTIAGDSDTKLSMYIFAMNTIEGDGGHYRSPCAMRLYAARFWTGDGATLARDFVPARRMNGGALGLYDKMNGNFYEKKGSGSFTAGPVISAASGPAGELWVDVPEGVVNVNANVVIAGSAKLVKSGKGTYRTEVLNQTYTGGTRVADGVFEQGVYSENDSMPMGQNSVTVEFDKEADVEWLDACYFKWDGDEKPENTTFVLSQKMEAKGFLLTVAPDGVYIKRQKFFIFLR